MNDYVDAIDEIMIWNEQANIPVDNDPVTLEAKRNHIVEEAQELLNASSEEEQCDACVDLIWVIVGYMRAKGWDVANAINEVAEANYSKFFHIEESDKAISFALENGYKAPYVEALKHNKEFGVLKDITTKVKKPHTFSEPDHSGSVNVQV